MARLGLKLHSQLIAFDSGSWFDRDLQRWNL